MKKQLLIAVGLCAGFIASAVADSRVTVYYPGQSQTTLISGLQNLQQLTARPELAGRTWWPGTVIAERGATAAAEGQQRQLLARLSALAGELRQDNDAELAATVETISRQLAAIRVTGRQFVSLDQDQIRLIDGANRSLRGEYSVYTLNRPTSIRVFGAVTPGGSQPFQVSRDVSDYLQTHQYLQGADKSEAWVILPEGASQQVPVAYWNRRHNELAPGSVVYVGFSRWALPRAYKDLNEQIVSLLTHRIPD